ncbi:hypothetical protein M8J76_015506 [Diaphorina citri]|nr:hypothetical protein M8J76_015506 [Diaphorina citri]
MSASVSSTVSHSSSLLSDTDIVNNNTVLRYTIKCNKMRKEFIFFCLFSVRHVKYLIQSNGRKQGLLSGPAGFLSGPAGFLSGPAGFLRQFHFYDKYKHE